MNTKKTLIIVFCLVAFFALVVGCVEKPLSEPTVTPTTPPKTELSLGESVTINGITFVVDEYEFTNSFIMPPSNFTIPPPEGAKFLWVHVKAKNICEVPRYLPWFIMLHYKGIEIREYTASYEKDEYTSRYYSLGERKMYRKHYVYPYVSKEGWMIYTVPATFDTTDAKLEVMIPPQGKWYGKSFTWWLA